MEKFLKVCAVSLTLFILLRLLRADPIKATKTLTSPAEDKDCDPKYGFNLPRCVFCFYDNVTLDRNTEQVQFKVEKDDDVIKFSEINIFALRGDLKDFVSRDILTSFTDLKMLFMFKLNSDLRNSSRIISWKMRI